MMFVYLASPYSHESAEVRLKRFTLVCQKAAKLMMQGYTVFSPIAHSHPIADYLDPDYLIHHEFWMKQDLPILKRSDKLIVLTLDGWRDSKGIKHELSCATVSSVQIEYHDMQGLCFPHLSGTTYS